MDRSVIVVTPGGATEWELANQVAESGPSPDHLRVGPEALGGRFRLTSGQLEPLPGSQEHAEVIRFLLGESQIVLIDQNLASQLDLVEVVLKRWDARVATYMAVHALDEMQGASPIWLVERQGIVLCGFRHDDRYDQFLMTLKSLIRSAATGADTAAHYIKLVRSVRQYRSSDRSRELHGLLHEVYSRLLPIHIDVGGLAAVTGPHRLTYADEVIAECRGLGTAYFARTLDEVGSLLGQPANNWTLALRRTNSDSHGPVRRRPPAQLFEQLGVHPERLSGAWATGCPHSLFDALDKAAESGSGRDLLDVVDGRSGTQGWQAFLCWFHVLEELLTGLVKSSQESAEGAGGGTAHGPDTSVGK